MCGPNQLLFQYRVEPQAPGSGMDSLTINDKRQRVDVADVGGDGTLVASSLEANFTGQLFSITVDLECDPTFDPRTSEIAC